MRVEYCHCRRHLLVSLMMIGDNDVHTQLGSQRHFSMRGGPAIRCHEQGNPLIMQPLDRTGIESITFTQSMRHIGADVCAELTKEREIQASCCDAVYIVVAIKADRLTGHDGPMEPLYGLIHIGNQKRIVRQLMRHPCRRLVWRGHATREEQRCGRGSDREGL